MPPLYFAPVPEQRDGFKREWSSGFLGDNGNWWDGYWSYWPNSEHMDYAEVGFLSTWGWHVEEEVWMYKILGTRSNKEGIEQWKVMGEPLSSHVRRMEIDAATQVFLRIPKLVEFLVSL